MKNITQKNTIRSVVSFTVVAALASAISSTSIADNTQTNGVKILEAHFDTRNVVQVEAGDFHFTPGQVAPIHTHSAPAVGYIVKGEIIFQVEGHKQVILREGDAFYEPAGPRILRFDNASATEEAVFIDFNLEQEGEPFIVFEKPPTEAIDRRTLPTTVLGGRPVKKVDIFRSDVGPGETVSLESGEPIFGIVAQGVVIVRESNGTPQRVVAGGTFAIPNAESTTTIDNGSIEAPAKVIVFRIL